MNSSRERMIPFDAQEPVERPKLSEMSNAPLLPVIAASCACVSGLDVPSTRIADWLALNFSITLSSALASAPVHRYENRMVTGPSESPESEQPDSVPRPAAEAAPIPTNRRRESGPDPDIAAPFPG